MFYQIINNFKSNFNQIAVSKKTDIVKAIKLQGWELKDCSIKELDNSLKNGFNVKTGNRNKKGHQFAQRAGV
jgi:hypothetical protein